MTGGTSQRRIGLTGGIASGKSTVAHHLSEHFGVPVLDADLHAREALAPGRPAERAVLEHFGASVQAPDGGIDRAALGRLVFNDPQQRAWLEALIHPMVRQRFAEELRRLQAEPAVVLMIPLLFEGGLQGLCDEIWVVSCDENEQRRRLMARDQLTPADAEARLAAQWPLTRKRELADVVIENRGSREALLQRVNALWASTSLNV